MARPKPALFVLLPGEVVGLSEEGAARLKEHRIWAVVGEHLGLCGLIAPRYLGRGLEREDLIQEGAFGLYRAVELFDRTRGIKFTTYARHWIKESMVAAVRATGGNIRVEHRALRRQDPLALLAHRLLPVASIVGGLLQPVAREPLDEELLEQVRRALPLLEPREREVLIAVFLDQILPARLAVAWGVSRQRICQVRDDALSHLRLLLHVPPEGL